MTLTVFLRKLTSSNYDCDSRDISSMIQIQRNFPVYFNSWSLSLFIRLIKYSVRIAFHLPKSKFINFSSHSSRHASFSSSSICYQRTVVPSLQPPMPKPRHHSCLLLVTALTSPYTFTHLLVYSLIHQQCFLSRYFHSWLMQYMNKTWRILLHDSA